MIDYVINILIVKKNNKNNEYVTYNKKYVEYIFVWKKSDLWKENIDYYTKWKK